MGQRGQKLAGQCTAMNLMIPLTMCIQQLIIFNCCVAIVKGVDDFTVNRVTTLASKGLTSWGSDFPMFLKKLASSFICELILVN